MARLKVWHLLVGLIVAASFAEVFPQSGEAQGADREFEYRTVRVSQSESESVAPQQLRRLGANGWELVAFEEAPARYRFRRPR